MRANTGPDTVGLNIPVVMEEMKHFSPQPLNMYCLYCPIPYSGNWETMRFLLSNARWWLDEYKFDGYRFDGEAGTGVDRLGRGGEGGGARRVPLWPQ